MKKLITAITIFFMGCSTHNLSIDQKIKEIQTESKILQKYQISKNSIVKSNNNYFFYEPTNDGIIVYKLDKNYNIKKNIKIKKLIDVAKIKTNNKNLYILGYDEQKNSPVLIILDNKLNKYKLRYIGHKFDVPKDLIIQKNPIVLLIHYNNGAFLEICKTNCQIFKKRMQPDFIRNFNNGFLVIGSVKTPKEDLIIVFIKDNKIIWSKIYDFGMQDTPYKVKIKNKNAIIRLISQDYMGAEKDITIEINKKGDIIKKQKNIEFKQLPTKFRT